MAEAEVGGRQRVLWESVEQLGALSCGGAWRTNSPPDCVRGTECSNADRPGNRGTDSTPAIQQQPKEGILSVNAMITVESLGWRGILHILADGLGPRVVLVPLLAVMGCGPGGVRLLVTPRIRWRSFREHIPRVWGSSCRHADTVAAGAVERDRPGV